MKITVKPKGYKTGRPTKIRKQYIKLIKRHVKLGGHKSILAENLDISLTTLYYWMNNVPELKDLIQKQKRHCKRLKNRITRPINEVGKSYKGATS